MHVSILQLVIQVLAIILAVASVSALSPGQHSIASSAAKADPYTYASHAASVAGPVPPG